MQNGTPIESAGAILLDLGHFLGVRCVSVHATTSSLLRNYLS